MAEKARLAHGNSIYARENRFLREIVEYHQLTMQNVVYLDEGMEEVTEVYPMSTSPGTITKMLFSSVSPNSPTSPSFLSVPKEDVPKEDVLAAAMEDVPKEDSDGEEPTPTTVSEEEDTEKSLHEPF